MAREAISALIRDWLGITSAADEDAVRSGAKLDDLLTPLNADAGAWQAASDPAEESGPRTKAGEQLEAVMGCLRLLRELREQHELERRSDPDSDPTWHRLDPAKIPKVEFDRFQLKRELGRGGFGIVFLAYDPNLKRDVALKLPRPDCLLTEELRDRFLKEGLAAASLDHPNILPVFEAGTHAGICFLTTAYCQGPTLEEWLRQRTEPVPPPLVARLVAELADGIEHAHCRRILHRDLKPTNVLLAPRHTDGDMTAHGKGVRAAPAPGVFGFIPKISDFGLAKVIGDDNRHTRTGLTLGTPDYMAPEQAEGRTADVGCPTDVFALGAILYELLTLSRPFAASSDLEVLRRVSTEEPVTPRSLRATIPRDLQSICLKCLSKAPGRRYLRAGDLAADLRRFLSGEPVRARPPSVGERLLKLTRRRPALAMLVLVSLFATAILMAATSWYLASLSANNRDLKKAVDEARTQRTVASRHAREVNLQLYASRMRLAGELLQDGRLGPIGEILNDMRPPSGESDLREFTWYYAWRVARNRQWLRGHFDEVADARFSADGRWLASVAHDRTLRIWDANTGKLARTIPLPFAASRVVWSSDGRFIAVALTQAIPGTVQVYSLPNEYLFAQYEEEHGLCGIAFAPHTSALAVARANDGKLGRGRLMIWDLATDVRQEWLPEQQQCSALEFSRDGAWLAVACETHTGPSIQILDAVGGEVRTAMTGLDAPIVAMAFTSDGQTLASGGHDGITRTWDVATGMQRLAFAEQASFVPQVAFADGGRTLLAGVVQQGEYQLRFHDVATGHTTTDAVDDLRGFACCAGNGKFAMWLDGPGLMLRKLHPEPTHVTRAAHPMETWDLDFSPTGDTLATSSDDHTIKLWNVEKLLTVPDASLEEACFQTLEGHEALVSCLAYDPSGSHLASGSYDATVRLWPLATGQPPVILRGHYAPVRTLAYSPDGRLLASGSRDQTIKLWDTATGENLATLEGHTSDVRCVAFSPDGNQLASVGNGRRLRLWNVANRALIADVEVSVQVWSVAFQADGESLVTGDAQGSITFWSLPTLQHKDLFGGHANGALAVAFSPDGVTLASAGEDRTVRLWHVPTGHELACFGGMPQQVNAVAFSPRGDLLAAALHDGTVRLWSARGEAESPGVDTK